MPRSPPNTCEASTFWYRAACTTRGGTQAEKNLSSQLTYLLLASGTTRLRSALVRCNQYDVDSALTTVSGKACWGEHYNWQGRISRVLRLGRHLAGSAAVLRDSGIARLFVPDHPASALCDVSGSCDGGRLDAAAASSMPGSNRQRIL